MCNQLHLSAVLTGLQIMIIFLGLLKLTVLMLWALGGASAPRTHLTLAAASLNFVTVFPLCALSYFDHAFRVAPSFWIELYLLVTVGLDAVRVRTLWLMPFSGHVAIAAAESAALALKIVLASVEASRKDGLLLAGIGQKYSKEQLAGLYGRSLFLWLAGTLWNGMLSCFCFIGQLTEVSQDSPAFLIRRICRAHGMTKPQSFSVKASAIDGHTAQISPARWRCFLPSSGPCRTSF